MREVLLAGTIAALLAFGTIAAKAANPSAGTWPSYGVVSAEPSSSGASHAKRAHRGGHRTSAELSEGRAAYVGIETYTSYDLPGVTQWRWVHRGARGPNARLTEGRSAYAEGPFSLGYEQPGLSYEPGLTYDRPGLNLWREPESYVPPESTYGRQTPNYGPGITLPAPLPPYRWAFSTEHFPGLEFMRGR
jgi:hypothetical protein